MRLLVIGCRQLICVIFLFLPALALYADTLDHSMQAQRPTSLDIKLGAWFSFTYENDGFGFLEKTDDGYSSGITASWGYGVEASLNELNLPRWMDYLASKTYLARDTNDQYFHSYGIHQGIYTPTDLDSEALVEDDRPYAGTLLWEGHVYAANNKRANSLQLALGIVGPASLA